jgi:uncharacterized membrane protein
VTDAWVRQLTRWIDAGLIDEQAAERIRALEAVNADSSRLRWPVWLALAFGALTIGAGMLLFVSAHWDSLSPQSRFALVTAFVATFHVGGALTVERFPSMASTLHGIGTVTLGAGIALAGQIFNLNEHWPGAILLWALGAGGAWALLRDSPQLGLFALLLPAWLTSEWFEATNLRFDASTAVRVAASGLFLLALTYFTAVGRSDSNVSRRVLLWIGGVALPIFCFGLALASAFPPEETSTLSRLPAGLAAVGWNSALVAPFAVAALLRTTHAWPHLLAAGWVIVLLNLKSIGGELALYGWWGLGATALVAWAVVDWRSERVNMGAAIFAATIVAFYFSQVMDKLGRSTSLVGLGLLFLLGGWTLERVRRRLVVQARGGRDEVA